MTMNEWVLSLNTLVVIFLAWQSIRYFEWRERIDAYVCESNNRLDLLQSAMMRADASIAKVSEDVDKRTAP